MSVTIALVAVLAIIVAAGGYAFAKAKRIRLAASSGAGRLNSLPVYHAFYVALWAALPALLFLAVWAPVQSGLVDRAVLATPAGRALPAFEMQRDTILAEARDLASGAITAGFNPESTALAPIYAEASTHYAAIGGAIAIVLALAGAGLAAVSALLVLPLTALMLAQAHQRARTEDEDLLQEVAQKIRMRALQGLPPAVLGIGDHAASGRGIVEQIVQRVGDRKDEHGGQKQLREPERNGQIRLGQR